MGFFNDIDWNKMAKKGIELAQKAGKQMEEKK